MMKGKFSIALTALLFVLASCHKKETKTPEEGDPVAGVQYRNEMRSFVMNLAEYARDQDPNFIVIPQNGQALATATEDISSTIETEYLATIDGQGREELFYGYDNNDDMMTPQEETDIWMPHLELMRDNGVRVLVTDYCSTPTNVDDSYVQNEAYGFISYAADSRDLNIIAAYPSPIHEENDAVIGSLDDAHNFLYLIDTQDYLSKQELIDDVTATNYDVIIMDAFFEDEEYTSAEINQLRQKANGGMRLVIAYMSIGEAEDYRYYWQPAWSFNAPEWMGSVNPDWPGNYKIDYWNSEWQAIIYRDEASYIDKILDAGFDGTYLDLIDAYEYWEEN